MHGDQSHHLLQQIALSVNPFIELPKAPTLPHDYATVPSTLPHSVLNAAPSGDASDRPAYVTSTSGYAAHPRAIIAQNKSLLSQFDAQRAKAAQEVLAWEQSIDDRELQEKRRKAPGWLDSENKLLEPEKPRTSVSTNAAPFTATIADGVAALAIPDPKNDDDDLGAAMDSVFGSGK